MASLRDIKKHIQAVKNIRQITYAMKMVSSARIKKAQNQILSFKPYASELEDVIVSLKNEMLDDEFKKLQSYDLFVNKNNTKKIGLVLITGDRGLCGSFNTVLINTALKFIKSNQDKKIYLITVGKKGYDFFKKLKNDNLEISYQMYNIFPKVNYSHASLLVDEIMKCYRENKLESFEIIYSEFINMVNQKPKKFMLFPVMNYIEENIKDKEVKFDDFIFEPSKMELLSNLIPKYINIEVLKVLLENQVSELASRMSAMELASKNAGELIEELTVKMNKLRQAQITTELTEIVSGAAAVSE
jgi:F-type H+-transporting ATPase subunit gamma